MHHYFEAITNTSGDSLVGYFARVIDPATQNTVTMSADDNGTPIVTKSGVDNMGSTDDYGNLDFYVVPGTYHLDIYAPNATSFIFRVPSVAMNSSKGDTGAPGATGDVGPSDATFATLATLKAINPAVYPSPRLAAPSGSDGGEVNGPFTYQTGDFTGRTDVVQLNGVPLTVGALVRPAADTITVKRPETFAIIRPANDKLKEIPSVYDWAGAGSDDTMRLTRALAAADTVGGKGAALYVPTGAVLTIGSTITYPQLVRLIGEDMRSCIINFTGTGPLFYLNSPNHCSIERFRIAMNGGAGVAQTAIKIDTASGSSAQWNTFDRLQIVGNGTAGKRGFDWSTSGAPIIADSWVTDCQLQSLDLPVRCVNTEGNHWHNLIIDQWGYSANPIAMDMTTLAEHHMDIRIAGAPATGAVGYRQRGIRNKAVINTDIGPSATSVNLDEGYNFVNVTRPELLTPLGPVGLTNTVIDTETFFTRRISTRGSEPVGGNFTLGAGWGAGASVSVLSGSHDQALTFTVTAGSGGFSANPVLAYNFADGAWPQRAPQVILIRDRGNQFDVKPALINVSVNDFNFVFNGTPAAGEAYTYRAILL